MRVEEAAIKSAGLAISFKKVRISSFRSNNSARSADVSAPLGPLKMSWPLSAQSVMSFCEVETRVQWLS